MTGTDQQPLDRSITLGAEGYRFQGADMQPRLDQAPTHVTPRVAVAAVRVETKPTGRVRRVGSFESEDEMAFRAE